MKNRVIDLLTRIIIQLGKNDKKKLINRLNGMVFLLSGEKVVEDYDYYSMTTAFAIDELKKSNVKLEEAGCLSITCLVRYMIPLMAVFKNFIHCTMVKMEDRNEAEKILSKKCIEIDGDFFEIEHRPEFDGIEVCISEATIHCMTDPRYGNDENSYMGGYRPYMFAAQLNKLFPNVRHVIASVPINVEENIHINNVVLSNEKFIKSFTDNGYKLVRTLYDKKCLGENEYQEGQRYSESMPLDYLASHYYVVGNYHFSK